MAASIVDFGKLLQMYQEINAQGLMSKLREDLGRYLRNTYLKPGEPVPLTVEELPLLTAAAVIWCFYGQHLKETELPSDYRNEVMLHELCKDANVEDKPSVHDVQPPTFFQDVHAMDALLEEANEVTEDLPYDKDLSANSEEE